VPATVGAQPLRQRPAVLYSRSAEQEEDERDAVSTGSASGSMKSVIVYDEPTVAFGRTLTVQDLDDLAGPPWDGEEGEANFQDESVPVNVVLRDRLELGEDGLEETTMV
jgi:hypothetical protein